MQEFHKCLFEHDNTRYTMSLFLYPPILDSLHAIHCSQQYSNRFLFAFHWHTIFFFCNFNFQVYAAIQHVKFVSRLLHVNRHSRYIIALTRKNDPTNAPFVIRHLPQRLVTSKCVSSADARTHANISHFYFGFSVYIHIYNLLSSGLF